MVLFEEAASRSQEAGTATLSGDDAFRLHDTHGFPIELTQELAGEQGLDVDMAAFEAFMDQQRRRAQESAKRGDLTGDALARAAGRGGPSFIAGWWSPVWSARGRTRMRRWIPMRARPRPGPTRPRTSCTGRCDTCSASTPSRPDRSWCPAACGSTSATTRP